MAQESGFKQRFMKSLREELPDPVLFQKTDATTHQGIPDLLIQVGNKVAYVETKAEQGASHRPGQDEWVAYLNSIGCYAAFAYPENKWQIIEDLKHYFYPEDYNA